MEGAQVKTEDMRSATGRRRARAHRGLLAGAALALSALAAGCSTMPVADVNLHDYDYRERHPIMISEEPEVLDMRVGMNGPALSPEIEMAVQDYVRSYQQDGTGGITIQVPTGSANAIAAGKTGRAVHYALVRAGVPQSHISVAPYNAGDYSKVASLRLSYLRVKAVAPRCGIWPETQPNTFRNADLHNFGCASQQNLAAMVANPADLVRPQPMGTANGSRRAKVITDYSKGDETRSNIMLIESDIE
jgi:pilus assembly protein CpaD